MFIPLADLYTSMAIIYGGATLVAIVWYEPQLRRLRKSKGGDSQQSNG